MDKATRELLEAHQAIIDAWYATWLERERRRIDDLWSRKRGSLPRCP
jgi:hypothetical protein